MMLAAAAELIFRVQSSAKIISVESEESQKLLLFRRSRNVNQCLSIGIDERPGGHCLFHVFGFHYLFNRALMGLLFSD